MGAKGDALARQFEAKAREAAHILERVTAADWQKVTEAEKWSVGVTAHHLATSYERVPDIATGLARVAQLSVVLVASRVVVVAQEVGGRSGNTCG